MSYKEWVTTDELTPDEIQTLLARAGGWVIIDPDKDLIYNFVYQKWEPLAKKENLVTRIKEDLKALKAL